MTERKQKKPLLPGHQVGCKWIPPHRDVDGRFGTGGAPECGGEFVCARCKQKVGWCRGCDDEDPYLAELCDNCWLFETKVREDRAKLKKLMFG